MKKFFFLFALLLAQSSLAQPYKPRNYIGEAFNRIATASFAQVVMRRPQYQANLGVVTFDAATASTSASFSHTIGTGINPAVVVLVGTTVADIISPAVTYGGTAVTVRGSKTDPVSTAVVYIFAATTNKTGANTCAVTGFTNVRYVACVTLFGVDQTTPYGGNGSANGSSSTPASGTPLGFNANDMILGAICSSSTSDTMTASQTIIGSSTNGVLFQRRGTSGEVSSSTTITEWAALAITINHD